MKRYTGKRRCIKAVVYLYVPMAEDSKKTIRDYACHLGSGRITLFDKVNERPEVTKPFTNLGGMVKIIADEYSKRARRRVPRR